MTLSSSGRVASTPWRESQASKSNWGQRNDDQHVLRMSNKQRSTYFAGREGIVRNGISLQEVRNVDLFEKLQKSAFR